MKIVPDTLAEDELAFCSSGSSLLFLDIVWVHCLHIWNTIHETSLFFTAQVNFYCRHASVHVPANLADKLAFKQEYWFVAVYKIWHVLLTFVQIIWLQMKLAFECDV